MKKLKLNSKRKSSGQVIVLLIIVLVLLGGACWWLDSNQAGDERRKGQHFAKDATQHIAVQHDINFFNSRLSPQARMNFPASTQQEFMNEIVKLGAPVRPVDVQGKIEFQFTIFRAARVFPYADILSSEIRRYGSHDLAPGWSLAN